VIFSKLDKLTKIKRRHNLTKMSLPSDLFQIVATYFNQPEDYVDVDLNDSAYVYPSNPPRTMLHFMGGNFCNCGSDWNDSVLWMALNWVEKQALIVPGVHHGKLSFDIFLPDLTTWRLGCRIKTKHRPENNHRFIRGIGARIRKIEKNILSSWDTAYVYSGSRDVRSLDAPTVLTKITSRTHWTNWPMWQTLSLIQKVCAILTYCPTDEYRCDWIRWKTLSWFHKQETSWHDTGERPKDVKRAFTASDDNF
jgi:hypothetical protein